MKTREFHQCLLGILLSGVITVSATEYHVDQRHPRASDQNPGTKEKPLKTISAAAKLVKPGDTVTVAPGVYRETVKLTVSGEKGKAIVFRSLAKHQAEIRGSDVVTDWHPAGPGVWATDVPDLPKPNKWAMPHSGKGGQWVYIDGSPLQYAEERARQTPGTFHLDSQAKKLYVSPAEGDTPKTVKIEYARRSGLFRPVKPLDDIHISGFKLIHNADWVSAYCPPILIKGRRWRVTDNHILWSSSCGIIMTKTSEARLTGNLIEWIGNQGVGGKSNWNFRFENNQIRCCGWRRNNPSNVGTGGSKWCYSFECVVNGNQASYNYGSGIWFDWANAYNIYEDNLCHDNAAWGLFSECNWDETFRNNVIYNNSQGLVIGESPGCVAQHNICFNNDYGVMIRGQYTRSGGAGYSPEQAATKITNLKNIPDLPQKLFDRAANGLLKNHLAVKKFWSNNSVVWENLLFDNQIALWEARDYGKPTALDPYVNNLSDHNLFGVPKTAVGNWSVPVLMGHRAGGYATLSEWRQVSGRDLSSTEIEVRNAKNLPAWAESKRALWDIPMRRRPEIRSVRLVQGPAACLAWGRWLRSPRIEKLPLSNTQIKAYLLEVHGERTLILWTGSEMSRRYLRLAFEVDKVVVKDGYLRGGERRLPAKNLDLVVSWLPTYVSGFTGQVKEAPSPALTVAPFNPPDRPVKVTMTFPNPGAAPLKLDARLAVSQGFTAKPASFQGEIKPGKAMTCEAELVPDGTFRSGPGLLRLEAKTGAESVSRTAIFSVGESGGDLPSLGKTKITIDGQLDDWKPFTKDQPPAGSINEAKNLTNPEKESKWSGPDDLSANIFASWTPKAFYLAAIVKDDQLHALPAPADPWNGDCVEVFFDGRSGDMQWQLKPSEGCVQIGVAPSGDPAKPNVVVWTRGGRRRLPGLKTAAAKTKDGYAVEMMFPLSLRNFPAGAWKEGRPVKLSVIVYDRDNPDTPNTDCTMGWAFSPKGANFRDTTGWKALILK